MANKKFVPYILWITYLNNLIIFRIFYYLSSFIFIIQYCVVQEFGNIDKSIDFYYIID